MPVDGVNVTVDDDAAAAAIAAAAVGFNVESRSTILLLTALTPDGVSPDIGELTGVVRNLK